MEYDIKEYLGCEEGNFVGWHVGWSVGCFVGWEEGLLNGWELLIRWHKISITTQDAELRNGGTWV